MIARGTRWTGHPAAARMGAVEPISGVAARSERDGILRRIKLVGEPEAMAWVARTLSAGGLLVDRHDEKEITEPDFFSHWPLVWVTRPEAFGRGFVRLRSINAIGLADTNEHERAPRIYFGSDQRQLVVANTELFARRNLA